MDLREYDVPYHIRFAIDNGELSLLHLNRQALFSLCFSTLSGKSHGRCAFSHFLQISGVASGTKWLLKDIKQNWNEELICCNELRSGSVHSILRQQNYLSNFLMPRMIR